MCYTIKNKIKAAALRKKYNAMADESLDASGYYHISGFDHPKLPVLTQENRSTFQLYYWGLIPSWCPSEAKAQELSNIALNARAETIFEKPMFRDAMQRKRCILPIEGFYEWREENKIKYPYFIYPATDEVFTLACVSDTWTDTQTGEVLNTFSIVTTAANTTMEMIHNKKKRMPLILNDTGWEKWLDSTASKEDLQNLMKPAPDNILRYHTVSKAISKREFDTNNAEIVAELKYPELENRLF